MAVLSFIEMRHTGLGVVNTDINKNFHFYKSKQWCGIFWLGQLKLAKVNKTHRIVYKILKEEKYVYHVFFLKKSDLSLATSKLEKTDSSSS